MSFQEASPLAHGSVENNSLVGGLARHCVRVASRKLISRKSSLVATLSRVKSGCCLLIVVPRPLREGVGCSRRGRRATKSSVCQEEPVTAGHRLKAKSSSSRQKAARH